jgi:hypothetical protein
LTDDPRHHLHGTRPLPQPPLCDLLPPAYLSSLKRTEARVRFADSHAGPSGSTSTITSPEASLDDPLRPGLRRRGTGPPTQADRDTAGESTEEWELGNLRDRAEEAVARLAEAVAGSNGQGADIELRQQLSQLNLPTPDRGGWSDAKRDRGLAVVKTLASNLGNAERLSSSESLAGWRRMTVVRPAEEEDVWLTLQIRLPYLSRYIYPTCY